MTTVPLALKRWFLLRSFAQLLRGLSQRHLLAVTRHFGCGGELVHSGTTFNANSDHLILIEEDEDTNTATLQLELL